MSSGREFPKPVSFQVAQSLNVTSFSSEGSNAPVPKSSLSARSHLSLKAKPKTRSFFPNLYLNSAHEVRSLPRSSVPRRPVQSVSVLSIVCRKKFKFRWSTQHGTSHTRFQPHSREVKSSPHALEDRFQVQSVSQPRPENHQVKERITEFPSSSVSHHCRS